MRRSDRQLSETEALIILDKGEYGTLSLSSAAGEPYGIPVNYCSLDGKVYLHCAMDGYKIDLLAENPRASFCVVGDTEVLPGSFGSKYESCIVSGVAAEALGVEKQKALEGLIFKYSGEYVPEGMKYIEKLSGVTRVFGISIDSISGKACR